MGQEWSVEDQNMKYNSQLWLACTPVPGKKTKQKCRKQRNPQSGRNWNKHIWQGRQRCTSCHENPSFFLCKCFPCNKEWKKKQLHNIILLRLYFITVTHPTMVHYYEYLVRVMVLMAMHNYYVLGNDHQIIINSKSFLSAILGHPSGITIGYLCVSVNAGHQQTRPVPIQVVQQYIHTIYQMLFSVIQIM